MDLIFAFLPAILFIGFVVYVCYLAWVLVHNIGGGKYYKDIADLRKEIAELKEMVKRLEEK